MIIKMLKKLRWRKYEHKTSTKTQEIFLKIGTKDSSNEKKNTLVGTSSRFDDDEQISDMEDRIVELT